jgi:NAD(P)-dependent dehydrogenase (short-subunit alcohol dehydrogenase family)
VRRRGAASARLGRRRDLHHGLELRSALRAAARAYAVTKAAALALARQVARDYSSEGIRVNALCPGWIDTPFNTPAWENFGGRERFLAEVPRLVPLGRIGSAEEAGKLACFLLSDAAAYMTGHALVADGGECLPG